MDVGGTTVAAGLVAADGQVLEHQQAPTHARGPGTALDTIGELLARLCEQARALGVTVTGVGIGVPGIVDAERGTVGVDVHYAPELARAPLAAMLGERLGVPVHVDNDVNALALAEWTWGAGRGARSLVMLALGTGVGGGIIIDGRLHRGQSGFGGELGHVPDRLRRAALHLRRARLPQGLRVGHRHRTPWERAARAAGGRGRGLSPGRGAGTRRRTRSWKKPARPSAPGSPSS